jgi:hypothetical protein
MDAFIFQFKAKQLRAIPSRYLGFLIASGHCCNELTILSPYIIFEHDLEPANDVEAAFILTRKFTIDRILISKIVEYGELYDRALGDAGDATDDVARAISADFQPIAAKIKEAKWARILRNRISFHYDPTHAFDALAKLDADHPLRLIAGRIKGVTLFDFAEEIVARPSFEAAGKGDIGSGMGAANKFIVELVSSITSFHARATKLIFRTYAVVSDRIDSSIGDQYCAKPGEVRVPLSILLPE